MLSCGELSVFVTIFSFFVPKLNSALSRFRVLTKF